MNFLVESFGTFKYRFILSVSRKTLTSPVHVCTLSFLSLTARMKTSISVLEENEENGRYIAFLMLWGNFQFFSCSIRLSLFVTYGLTVLIGVPYVDSLFCALVTKDLELCQRSPLHLLRWSHHFVLNIYLHVVLHLLISTCWTLHTYMKPPWPWCVILMQSGVWLASILLRTFVSAHWGAWSVVVFSAGSLPRFGIRIGDVNRTLPFLLGNHFRSVWQFPLQSDCSYGSVCTIFWVPSLFEYKFSKVFPNALLDFPLIV